MCGICGIADLTDRPVDRALLDAMSVALRHRGPDSAGAHLAPHIGLAARRLAVIDLSERASQPIPNEAETIWVVQNGEIYNFRELRRLLIEAGHRFRSDTDTEIIVHAYEEWGDACVERFAGMFAFAVWDAPRTRLLLARDRLGVKPLVYALDNRRLVFASELQALYRAVPPHREDLDPVSLDAYLAFGHLPPDRTLLRTCAKLPPAHRLVFDEAGVRVERYWKPLFRPLHELTRAEALDRTEALLRQAVKRRLVSDVPLGCFLSSGIDSGLVTALAAQESGARLRTFTVGFETQRPAEDERPFARLVAERYGTEHHELHAGRSGRERLPRLLAHFGEPFADLSALPVLLVSEAARPHITVALTGDGGDESFAGYANVRAAFQAFRARRIPAPLCALAARLMPRDSRLRRWHAQYLARPVADHYDLQNHWHTALRQELYGPALCASDASRAMIAAIQSAVSGLSDPEVHLCTDLQWRLPGDYLPKVDIASNLVSLEIRSPFLDHELVEFAARLPLSIRLRGGRPKALLRELAERHLPSPLIRLPKRGFGPRWGEWLRGPWAGLVREMLLEGLAKREDLFAPAPIHHAVEEHLAGRANHAARLWTLFCLEVWWRIYLDRTLSPEDAL